MSVGICPLAVAAYVIGILCQGLMTNHLSYVMRYIYAILGLLCHASHCQIVVPKFQNIAESEEMMFRGELEKKVFFGVSRP